MGSVLKMVALPVLLACLLTIIGLPLSLSQQGLVRRRVVTQVSYNSEPRRRVVRVRKKRPRVVVVQQRNRLDALPAVYPTQEPKITIASASSLKRRRMRCVR